MKQCVSVSTGHALYLTNWYAFKFGYQDANGLFFCFYLICVCRVFCKLLAWLFDCYWRKYMTKLTPCMSKSSVLLIMNFHDFRCFGCK